MATYLERYLNGEYEQVWDELVALGPKVREEPVLSDARAVAAETMRRVRANVETITERLKALRFEFVYPEAAFVPPDAGIVAQLDDFEREVGPIPLSIRAWAEQVGSVQWMGTYPGLSYYHHSAIAPTIGKFMQTGSFEPDDVRSIMGTLLMPPGTPQIDDDMLGRLTEQLNKTLGGFQSLFNNLPNSAMKDFIDQDYDAEPPQPHGPLYTIPEDEIVIGDPLVVDVGDISADFFDEWELDDEEAEAGPVEISIAPDVHHKSNYSGGGGYDVELPDPAADTVLLNEEHNTLFVRYLRIVFAWGGFPGAKDVAHRDQALIDRLKDGLLPF